jgi:hypothetical protein
MHRNVDPSRFPRRRVQVGQGASHTVLRKLASPSWMRAATQLEASEFPSVKTSAAIAKFDESEQTLTGIRHLSPTLIVGANRTALRSFVGVPAEDVSHRPVTLDGRYRAMPLVRDEHPIAESRVAVAHIAVDREPA